MTSVLSFLQRISLSKPLLLHPPSLSSSQLLCFKTKCLQTKHTRKLHSKAERKPFEDGYTPHIASPIVDHLLSFLHTALVLTIDMRLDAYSERFSQEGFTCILFDYRYFGKSTGKPRGLIDPERQLEDWVAAFEFTSRLDNVDPKRIGLFGTSFSGGHVVRVGALLGDRVAAIVSQCPFTDGFTSSLTVGLRTLPSLLLLSIRDTLFGTNDEPICVRILGEPNEVALMNAPDAKEGALKLLPEGQIDLNTQEVPARLLLTFPFLKPGAYFGKVKAPIFVAVCGNDSVAPPGPTLRYAIEAPKATIKVWVWDTLSPMLDRILKW